MGRLVAFDQSMHSTGVAVFDTETGNVLHTQRIQVPRRITGLDACLAMAGGIRDVVTNHRPEYVALEGLHLPSGGKLNAKTIINLGILWGMAAAAAAACRLVVVESNEVAEHLNLPYNATRKRRKARSQFYATAELYGQVHASDGEKALVQEDIADAVAIGRVALGKTMLQLFDNV